MELLQLGEGLRRQARIEPHRSLSFRDCFEIVSPKMEPSFQGILLRLASPFTIRTRPDTTQTGTKEKVKMSFLTDGAVAQILHFTTYYKEDCSNRTNCNPVFTGLFLLLLDFFLK